MREMDDDAHEHDDQHDLEVDDAVNVLGKLGRLRGNRGADEGKAVGDRGDALADQPGSESANHWSLQVRDAGVAHWSDGRPGWFTGNSVLIGKGFSAGFAQSAKSETAES